MRVSLLREAETEHVLVLTLHHTIGDGWSKDVLLRDLAALYEAEATGRPARLASPVMQWSEFARRQARLVEAGAFADGVAIGRGTAGGMAAHASAGPP